MELTLTGGDEPAGGGVKSSEPDPETPLRIRPAINGVLKRHLSPPVAYRDCLKNHAATLGGYAVDGCGEFMPSPTATSSDPTSLKCAACGCHRNFHRREPEDAPAASHVLDYQPHHRHHPPRARSPGSPSPPPPHYPSAPHMLLALTSDSGLPAPPGSSPNCRKRFRTKFSSAQKEKMLDFAERVGWKMQRRDDEMVSRFCSEVGVDRGVLKVWMHNNKNTFSKRDFNDGRSITIPNPDEEDDPRAETSDPRIPPSNAVSDCFSSRLEVDE